MRRAAVQSSDHVHRPGSYSVTSAEFLHSMGSMRTIMRNSATTDRRAAIVLPLIILMTACAGRTTIRTTTSDPTQLDISQLWVEPADLATRDLFYGPGGRALAPSPSTPFELIAVDNTGYSAGYDVRDPQGVEWSVKLGIEAQPEVATSRVLWALGFHQPPTYLLAQWELTGKQSGTQGVGRFRREAPEQKVVADWSWYQNPFVGRREYQGLIVANLLLNNWDWKTSNNKIYDIVDAQGTGRRTYVVRDLGASLGKTSFPQFLKWTPLRGMGQGSRNDPDGFEEQGFIKEVEGQRVKFHYRGIHQRLVDTVTVDDVLWTCRLMARISDQQWRDAFRAAGYTDADQQRFIAKIRSKIAEGLALGSS